MTDVELPLEAEEFLVWLASERGRARNTIDAYRRDLVAYQRWLITRDLTIDERHDGRSHRFRRRAAIVDGSHDVGRPAVGGDPHAAPLPGHGTGPPRRSHRTARRRPRAVGHSQAAQRGAGDEPARRGDRQRAARAPRSRPARTALRHRRSDLRGGRPLGRRHRLRRSRSCACSARDRRSASCPTARPRGAALDDWFSPSGRAALVPDRWKRRDDAEAVFLNQRGGRLSRQGAWLVDPQVRRSGRDPRPTCRRTCCATRAPRTCSTTAPTCGSCRRCSATRRSRRRRCTPRSARSGCGRSTGQPIRGRCTSEQDASHPHPAASSGGAVLRVAVVAASRAG